MRRWSAGLRVRDKLSTMTSLRLVRLLLLLGLLPVCTQCASGSEPSAPAARKLERDEVAFLIREGTAWVKAERDRHRPDAEALSDDEKRQFAGFFTPELLDSARVKVVSAIENPGFFAAYEELGKRFPLDLSRAVGLALDDTVLLVRSHGGRGTDARRSILFHELVHLAQYRLLGTDPYLERYVRELAGQDYEYRANPFEAQAFELQDRYRRQPGEVFAVEAEVRRRFAAAAGASGYTEVH